MVVGINRSNGGAIMAIPDDSTLYDKYLAMVDELDDKFKIPEEEVDALRKRAKMHRFMEAYGTPINIQGTVTGRMSCKEPNFTEIERAPRRSAMMPYDPDRVTATEIREQRDAIGHHAVCVIGGDFAKLEAVSLAIMLQDKYNQQPLIVEPEIMKKNMFKRVADMLGVKMGVSIAKIVSSMADINMFNREPSAPISIYGNRLSRSGCPWPKHINARQAWKNRGKTSKRKGTRK